MGTIQLCGPQTPGSSITLPSQPPPPDGIVELEGVKLPDYSDIQRLIDLIDVDKYREDNFILLYNASDQFYYHVDVASLPFLFPVTSVFGRTGDVVAQAGDYGAIQVTYNNTFSGYSAVTVQGAIDEIITTIISAGGPITTHSDVDTITTVPSIGDYLRWNGLNWIPNAFAVSLSFIGLTDTPLTYFGRAGRGLVVNATESGLEYSTGVFPNTTDDLPEGVVNLYFTEARVEATPAVVLNTAKVSADGSVDTHSDVDTTSSPPTVGEVLAWNGTNWIPGIGGSQSSDFLIPVGTKQGFALGDAVSWNGVTWIKANSALEENTAHGIIRDVGVDVSLCTIYGQFTWGHGLLINRWYYLNPFGAYTPIKPTAGILQPIFFTLSATSVVAYVNPPVNLSDPLFDTFLSLSDTPNTYSLFAGHTLRVDPTEAFVEYVAVGGHLGPAVTTTVPISGPVYGDFYLATQAGDYPSFPLIGVAIGSELTWDGVAWQEVVAPGAIAEPTSIGLWLREVSAGPVYDWSENIDGGTY